MSHRPEGTAHYESELRAQAEGLVVPKNEAQEEMHLLGDLVLANENVAIVLLELAKSRQSRERSRHFVSMEHVERDVPQRQLAV